MIQFEDETHNNDTGIGEKEECGPITELSMEEKMNEKLICAAERGDIQEVKYLVDKGATLCGFIDNTCPRGALHAAISNKHPYVVHYILQNSGLEKYCDLALECAFFDAITGGDLEIVKVLLEHGIRFRDGIGEAIEHGEEEIAQYFIEHNDDKFFELYSQARFDISVLSAAICKGMIHLVDFISKKYPNMLHESNGISEWTSLQNALWTWNFNPDIVKILKKHMLYVDVNLWNGMMSVMHNFVSLHNNSFLPDIMNQAKLYNGIRFLVAYGADVSAKNKLGQTVEEVFLGCGHAEFITTFNGAVAEGQEIWGWNQRVLREVVKWAGYVVRVDAVGLGKQAVEAVVRFVPAQFDEKLEVGTALLLRAQAMLESRHGVTFGDMHHGGYVKYKNATVTCDWHMEVRMKMCDGIKIVKIYGDSYVDRGVVSDGSTTALMHMLKKAYGAQQSEPKLHTRQNVSVMPYIRMWGEDAYDQKVCAQQQWHARSGEMLPTFAAIEHESIVVGYTSIQQNAQQLDNTQHLVGSVQHHEPTVLLQHVQCSKPHFTHISMQHPHISYELQPHIIEYHSTDFLLSFSLL